jgi:hypothetical protein
MLLKNLVRARWRLFRMRNYINLLKLQLKMQQAGAGSGNRTRLASLEG